MTQENEVGSDQASFLLLPAHHLVEDPHPDTEAVRLEATTIGVHRPKDVPIMALEAVRHHLVEWVDREAMERHPEVRQVVLPRPFHLVDRRHRRTDNSKPRLHSTRMEHRHLHMVATAKATLLYL